VSWPSCPAGWPRGWPRRASPGRTTGRRPDQPRLTIHESIGTPPSSTALATRRRTPALVRDVRPAGSLQYGSPLMHDRRPDVPHGLPRSGSTTRASRPSNGTSCVTASWSATNSTGGWPA
jgi:hypothetical protein